MKISASVHSSQGAFQTAVQTNDSHKTIVIDPKSTGGSSVNGGELLVLALATCFCNDIYREAARQNILVRQVRVEVSAAFGGVGEPGSGFKYNAIVDADASPEAIEALIEHTDKVAEVHNTLRQGVQVTLTTT